MALFTALAAAAALTAAVPATPVPAVAGDTWTVLRCNAPVGFERTLDAAAYGGAVELAPHSELRLVESGGKLSLLKVEQTPDGVRESSLDTHVVAHDHAEQIYHLGLKRDGADEHLLFSLNTDRTGQVMWVAPDRRGNANCSAR